MSQVECLTGLRSPDNKAKHVADLWTKFKTARQAFEEEVAECREYVYATNTKQTTNAKLPWKNNTHLPKLCQIMDNLHASYFESLFPNEEWVKWDAYSADAADKNKVQAITSYMANKLRISGFKDVVSDLLLDFILWGNCVATCEYVEDFYIDDVSGEKVVTYIGPRAKRIPMADVVWDPSATSFEVSPKIVRYVKTLGDLHSEALSEPEHSYKRAIVQKALQNRNFYQSASKIDVQPFEAMVVDGFGSFSMYMRSGLVEILEYHGDMYDLETGEFLKNHILTVVDRCELVRCVPNPSWIGKSYFVHAPWRQRAGNSYGQSPLVNLIGMQYRVDHLENIRADMFDLMALPPIKVRGLVDNFKFGPGEKIILPDTDSDVDFLRVDGTALQADSQIANLLALMEEFAGMPKEELGFRTPGEKTAFEVGEMKRARNKLPQQKIKVFEQKILEPLLNNMLELARRNINAIDTVSVLDTDTGALEFLNITRADLTAKGKIRAVGADHFAMRNNVLQNYLGFRQAFVNDPAVMSHVSGKAEAKLFEELLQLERYQLMTPNIRLSEQAETQMLGMQYQENLQVTQDQELPDGM